MISPILFDKIAKSGKIRNQFIKILYMGFIFEEARDFFRLMVFLLGRLANKKRLTIILLAVFLAVYALPLSVLRVNANNDISVGGLLWSEGMAGWGNNISVEPGTDFKITIYALNVSPMTLVANVAMFDQLPSRTAYVAGQAFVLNGAAWEVIADSGSSPFVNGMAVSNDAILSPSEAAQYKYTAHVENFVPTSASALTWSGPTLNFADPFGNQAKGSNETTAITLANVPNIQNVSVAGTSFNLGQVITISAIGPVGKTAYAQLTTGSGVKNIPLAGSGTSYSGSYTVAAGDAVSNATPRVFFEIASGRGSYADAPSAININSPALVAPQPAGGGSPQLESGADNGGLIAGAMSGIYPNGTLLRVAGQADVWRIMDGKKSLVPSADIFNSQFLWKQVIELPSDKQLSFYERTVDANFPVGTLLKASNNPAIYRFSINGGLQPVVSQEVFKARGYSKDLIKSVSQETISALSIGEPIVNAHTLYPGDLVKIQDGPTVWQIQSDGSGHYFSDENIFYHYVLSFKRVWTIMRSRMEQVSDRLTKMFYPDGMLVRGSTNMVYVISDRQKRPIATAADFNALLYKWENVKIMADADLNSIPTGNEIKVIAQQ